MKRRVKFRTLGLCVVCLLSLLLLIWPWSPSTQPGGFSLTLDLDPAEGDQAVSLLDVSPSQIIPIQIFGADIRSATGISVRFRYDRTVEGRMPSIP